MDQTQKAEHAEAVQKWLDAVQRYGSGWDEDAPEIPVDYEIDVDMTHYHQGGEFYLPLGDQPTMPLFPKGGRFSNPRYDIMCRVRRVKAHMNRMITAMEYAYRTLAEPQSFAVNIWDHVKLATELLKGAHHGTGFRTVAHAHFTTPLEAHVTKIPSSQKWDVSCGYYLVDGEAPRWQFGLTTTVFTTCPFVLFETKGKHSHTQRTHIVISLEADAPIVPGAIMREINQRLVPVMSAMKIPDEVVQVCKSYAGPTFTEDAAVRVVKILRGITAEFNPNGERIHRCHVRAISEDSHLAHDIETSLETDINT